MLSASKSGQYGGYTISRSVRLRSSASAYFSRTPGSTTNRQTYTWSGWVKIGTIGAVNGPLYQGYSSSTERTTFGYQSDVLYFIDTKSGTSTIIGTSAVYRDPSAWYHVVLSVDTTQATAANRTKIYINGVQQTLTGSYVAQNTNTYINQNVVQYIGDDAGAAGRFFDGYLTEINFIDGQALTPSSFGQYNAYGVWSPMKYTGTYGTNGFYLNFSNNASTTTLGYDTSGNGNNWTTNNISLTAGTTYDSMIDTPTPYADGGNGRGNYAVMNPLVRTTNNSGSISQADGNLSTGIGSYANTALGTIGVTSGKWYWEMTPTATNNGAYFYIGVAATGFNNAVQPSSDALQWAYYGFSGNKNNNSNVAYGATYTTNDVIGVALDMDAGTLTFYKNGTTQGQAFSNLAGNTIFPMCSFGNTGSITVVSNFGQRPFSYTPPTGFLALNTYNLPATTINNGATVMAATTYTGTGASLSVSNGNNNTTGVTFKPDLVWIKDRTTTNYHVLFNSIVGGTNYLCSNATQAETGAFGNITFNSNGFTESTGGTGIDNVGYNAHTYVAWQWQAGQGSSSSNTSGSITSTVSVNATAGFSVVSYTGNATAGATVGHGLGVAPSMVIVKDRASVTSWAVYHSAIGATNYLLLNSSQAQTTSAQEWNNTAPTSTVFTVGNSSSNSNQSAANIAYCWAQVAGYSKFGSYTGNGSADGPFVYCGFRPRFILYKRTDSSADWVIVDSSRSPYNQVTNALYPDLSNAEDTSATVDFTSNGFKFRGTAGNNTGATYIFAAFAENPFKYSLAR